MNNKINRPILFLMIVAAIIFIAGCSTQSGTPVGNTATGNSVSNTADRPVVKIGGIFVLSGDSSSLGESGANSAKLALSQLSANTKFKYELYLEDDRLDPKTSILAFQKLTTVDNVDAVISFSSGPGNAISPLANENQIIHCAIASDKNIAAPPYNFIHWTPPEEENRVMIKALQARNITKIAILQMNQAGVKAIVDDLKVRAKDANITITEYTFNIGEKDFRTNILKIRDDNPQVVLLEAFSPELELIANQFKELSVNISLTAIEAIEYTDQPQIFEGDWYVQAADANSVYRDAYMQAYDKDFKVGGPNAYDCVNLIVEAYENAGKYSQGKPSSQDVVKEFEKIKDFPGAVGNLTVDANHIVQSTAVVRMVKDGKFVTISR